MNKFLAILVLLICSLLVNALQLQKLNQSRAQNLRLQKSLDMVNASRDHLRETLEAATEQQEKLENVIGIYRYYDSIYGQYRKLDLRSDNSAAFQKFSQMPDQKTAWSFATNGAISVDHVGNFKLENGDLIDNLGHRWLHVR